MTITLERNFIFRKFKKILRSSKILLEGYVLYFILNHLISSYHITLSLPETSTINHQHDTFFKTHNEFSLLASFSNLSPRRIGLRISASYFGLDYCHAAHYCIEERKKRKLLSLLGLKVHAATNI